ncbi:unnamed protein product [Diamesa serratosioi]
MTKSVNDSGSPKMSKSRKEEKWRTSEKSLNVEVSPRREENRSVRTPKKQLLSPSKNSNNNRILEKSNSVGDSKPTKQLRTTKSLSPRPPVRQQHNITVSNVNNIVSMSVSPQKDLTNQKQMMHGSKGNIISDSSPEGVSIATREILRLDDDRQLANSTSCLVYVPSDPWIPSTNVSSTTKEIKKKTGSRSKKIMDMKSLSRTSLTDDHNDPWVWRDPHEDQRKKTKSNKKQRHSTSKSKLEDNKSNSGSRTPLQHTNTPVFFPDDVSNPLSSLSPKLGYHSVTEKTTNTCDKKKKSSSQFLNVSNPNLLQPRHSFSNTTSNKKLDDEQILNIRRLSEQMKYSNYFGSASSTATITNHSDFVNSNISKREPDCDKKRMKESLLETTC